MKLEFMIVVLMLLAAGSSGSNSRNDRNDRNVRSDKNDRNDKHHDRESYRRKYGFKCPPRSGTTFPQTTTSIPTTTPFDACEWCRGGLIQIDVRWAGHCFPDSYGSTCNCVCGDVFCSNDEIIDLSTCTPTGRLQDCRCISTIPDTTETPTSTPGPTLPPYEGCEWCLNSQLSVGDTFAGYCFPQPDEYGCYCLCADLFCENGQIIDRTTCVNGGSMADCRCIDTWIDTSSTEGPTTTTIEFIDTSTTDVTSTTGFD